MKREWHDALMKVASEGRCRVCGRVESVQAAHVIGRRHDDAGGRVDPRDIVPLCSRTPEGAGGCHQAYDDARTLDVLPYLTLEEQSRAALHVGLVGALRRTTNTRTTR